MRNLNGRVAIITGASSGIGRETAICLAKHGVRVVLAARSEERLQEVAAQINKPDSTLVVPTDVVNAEDCKHLINSAIEKFGTIDILICNAGISMRADFDKVNLDVIHRVMDVNFFGVVKCVHYALPHLLKSRGIVVGIGSVAGYIGLPGRTGYSASKFALRGFLETLRTENLHRGLRVCIVSPSYTASEIRLHALTADGSEQGASPRNEAKMILPENAARVVYKAIINNKSEVIFPLCKGLLPVWIHRIFPKFTSFLLYKMMSKEKQIK